MAFLSEKHATQCPMCNENQWVSEEDWPDARVSVSRQGREGGAAPPYFLAYMLYCGNCGFVSLHMKHIVDAEPPESDETDDE